MQGVLRISGSNKSSPKEGDIEYRTYNVSTLLKCEHVQEPAEELKENNMTSNGRW